MSVLSRVQSNPEIGTDDSAFVTELVERAKQFVISYCNLPRFPELATGYSLSATGASTDITGLGTTAALVLSVNGSDRYTIVIATAGMDTGAEIAAALQTAIQSLGDDAGLDEVTVTYADTQYRIASGRYGETSSIRVIADDGYRVLPRALKLGLEYGGTEYPGSAVDEEIESATVEVVEQLYRKMGVEGLTQFSLHQGEFGGTAGLMLDGATLARLRAKRRLF